MTPRPPLAEGDIVLVKRMAGLWRITRFLLTTDEAEIRRPYGRARRIVPVTDLLPRETEAQQ